MAGPIGGAWEFGGEIAWPDNNCYCAPTIPEPVINRPEEVDDLPDPDPLTAGMNPLIHRFNQVSRAHGFPAMLPAGTPSTASAGIVGRTRYLLWMIRHPQAVHKLQRKVTDFVINTSRVIIERYGGENCGLFSGVPMDSNQLISPKMFAEFAKPYIKEIYGFLVDSGVKSILVHLCGDHTPNLPHWKDIPLPPRTIFSIGHEMDLEATGRVIGPEHILGGNLSNSIMQLGRAGGGGRGDPPGPGPGHGSPGRFHPHARLRAFPGCAPGQCGGHGPNPGRARLLPKRRQAMNLKISGLCKCFSQNGQGERRVLDGIDLQVASGEFVSILGPSGCGKTTLIEIVAGLQPPDGGEISIGGQPMAQSQATCAIVFQQYALFPWLTVRGNIEYGLKIKGRGRGTRRAVSRRFIELVGLNGFEGHYPHELSGGMQQRVALARSLATEPDLLLLDEPFAALDSQTREECQAELLRIWRDTGVTIIFVTHDVGEAIFLGDRLVVMTGQPTRVRQEFPIAMPRPRTLDVKLEPAFRELEFAARRLLAEGRQS